MEGHVTDGWDDITAAQAQAIAALMTKPSVRAAAKSAGVGERTLYVWMKQRAFRQHLRDARKAVVDDSVLQLQKLAGSAVKVFERSLKCGIPGIELRAAQLVLGTAIEVQGLLDMADDLAELNLKIDAVSERKWGPGGGGDGHGAGRGPGGPPRGEPKGDGPRARAGDLGIEDKAHGGLDGGGAVRGGGPIVGVPPGNPPHPEGATVSPPGGEGDSDLATLFGDA